jgi:hypothetical protein
VCRKAALATTKSPLSSPQAKLSGAAAAVTASKFTLALCQMSVGADKAANLAEAERVVSGAVSRGANVVVLPECFNRSVVWHAVAATAMPRGDAMCYSTPWHCD